MVGYLGVFGHVVLDHIIAVPRLPRPNTSIGVLDRRQYSGGTAGNLARWSASLGVATSLAAFVGDDFPAEYARSLRESGVDCTDLRVVPGERTPVAWIFGDPRGNQMAVIDQAAMLRAPDQALQEHTVRNSSIVHLMTGQPRYYRKVAALAKRLARDLAVDPSQEIHYVYDAADLRSLLDGARYFFGNEAEVARAIKFLRLRSLRAFASRVPVVVETRGAKGSVVYDHGERLAIPRVRPARVVDASGAGDAYRAGFYAGLSRGYDLRDCGVLGATAASFAVETVGTQTNIPSWPRLLARAERFLS
ncbi:MAG TPA: carbohydrate kinase family protein [Thermoplasmata archaeon]|nr:carbohydrate kinase family protein [Thermoplasmata archaeon]